MCFNCPANLTIARQGLARQRMNPGKVTRRGAPLRSRESSTGCASKGAYHTDTVPAARVVCAVRIGLVMMLVAVAGLRAAQAGAQSAAMLDERVTQQSIAE